ncbi:MAG: hypothetical protein WCR02_09480 [Sphaerochaetaceae bacterium]
MAMTTVDIVELNTKLTHLRVSLENEYAKFGKSCALIERVGTLGSCQNEWKQYEECLNKTTEQEKEYEKLKTRLSILTDKKGHIREIGRQLKLCAKREKEVTSCLGASAYEAYSGKLLPPEGELFCKPFYESYYQKCKHWESLSKQNGFEGKFAQLRLRFLRKKAYGLFCRCGSALFGSDAYLFLSDGQMKKETEQLLQKEKELSFQAKECRQSINTLEEHTDKGKLDNAKSKLDGQRKLVEELACVYGKAVYEVITPEDIQKKVGQKAYSQGLQIARIQVEIAECQKNIKEAKCQMQIDELLVQIGLDKQKIAHLKEQQQALDKQISEVVLSINEKKKQIRTLSGGPA